MEGLKLRYQSLLKAYAALGEVLTQLTSGDIHDPEVQKIYRDSLIKRFEFSYDVTWKYLKYYLEKSYGITANSPKAAFRECFSQGIVSEEQLRSLLKMVDDRNLTSHTYNEALAEEVGNRIVNYFKLLNDLAKMIEPS